MAGRADQIDCTVVIPVFNRGEALASGIESLRVQTLGADRLEIIYIDDGSNDGRTPELIDQVVAETPNAQVFHEPPSGSPGRPRNIGLAHARGEYVFFCDHDDWFDPQALERMVGWASEHRADVVIGKVVAHGRRAIIPRLFRENRSEISPIEAMISLTPHKLFRRAFLDQHQIRYPEGRTRLEDHHFVVHAYLHARRISVLADHVCYHHAGPESEENFSQAPVDPVVYVQSNRDVIELIRRHTEHDPSLRNALLQRPIQHEVIKKAGPRLLVQTTPEGEAAKHRALRAALVEEAPDEVVDGLGAFQRATALALRRDDPEAVRRIDERARGLALKTKRLIIDGDGAVQTFEFRLVLAHEGLPVKLHRVGKNLWRIDEAVLGADNADRPERADQLLSIALEVLASHRRTEVQWHLPTVYSATLRRDRTGSTDADPVATLRIVGKATLDRSQHGEPNVGEDPWEVVLRAEVLGVTLRQRLSIAP